MARYQSGAVVYGTGIGGVTDLSVELGTETESDDSGSIYDETRSVIRQYPEIGFTTKSIAAVFDLIGFPGVCIDGSPVFDVYGNVLGDCKAPPLSTDNIKYTIGLGLLSLGQLSAARGADATISVMADAISDGTNAPILADYAGNALPTGLVTAQYTLGACAVGGIVLTDVASLSLSFGVQKTTKTPLAGSIWPDSIAIRKVQPVLTMQTFDPRVLDNALIPLLGKQGTHVNTLIQLKKRLNYSTFVLDATTQHILLTMNGICTVTTAFAGSGNGEASATIVVAGVHDGTNVPIIVDTTSIYDPTP